MTWGSWRRWRLPVAAQAVDDAGWTDEEWREFVDEWRRGEETDVVENAMEDMDDYEMYAMSGSESG
eukprot:6582654-Heterocapsa_arctica.AAC.1